MLIGVSGGILGLLHIFLRSYSGRIGASAHTYTSCWRYSGCSSGTAAVFFSSLPPARRSKVAVQRSTPILHGSKAPMHGSKEEMQRSKVTLHGSTPILQRSKAILQRSKVAVQRSTPILHGSTVAMQRSMAKMPHRPTAHHHAKKAQPFPIEPLGYAVAGSTCSYSWVDP